MPRVKRGVIAHARHKKVLNQAKGYYGARSRVFRVANQAVIKAGQYAYRDRRQRKRQLRGTDAFSPADEAKVGRMLGDR